jgi:hypothetical protein
VAVAAGDATVWRDARKGEGYADAHWRASPLARDLRATPAGASLYSNEPAAVWLLSERDARCPPRALARVRCGGLSVPPDKRREVSTPTYFAWFRGSDLVPPSGEAACRLSPVATRRDGTLFRVTGRDCGVA